MLFHHLVYHNKPRAQRLMIIPMWLNLHHEFHFGYIYQMNTLILGQTVMWENPKQTNLNTGKRTCNFHRDSTKSVLNFPLYFHIEDRKTNAYLMMIWLLYRNHANRRTSTHLFQAYFLVLLCDKQPEVGHSKHTFKAKLNTFMWVSWWKNFSRSKTSGMEQNCGWNAGNVPRPLCPTIRNDVGWPWHLVLYFHPKGYSKIRTSLRNSDARSEHGAQHYSEDHVDASVWPHMWPKGILT